MLWVIVGILVLLLGVAGFRLFIIELVKIAASLVMLPLWAIMKAMQAAPSKAPATSPGAEVAIASNAELRQQTQSQASDPQPKRSAVPITRPSPVTLPSQE
jgi:hypothetical protein